jgi:hypothetical protein
MCTNPNYVNIVPQAESSKQSDTNNLEAPQLPESSKKGNTLNPLNPKLS